MIETLVIVGAILGIAFAACLMIGAGLFVAVNKMAGPGARLSEVQERDRGVRYDSLLKQDGWAQGHGFDFLGTYFMNVMAPLHMVAWRHREFPTYLCVYRAGQSRVTEFVTTFPDDGGLTTSTTVDGHTLANTPGDFMQAFPGKSIDELWELHNSGLVYMIQNANLQPQATGRTFCDEITHSLRSQMAYIKTLAGWPLRGVYWYLIKRPAMRSKSIQQQHQSGRIRFLNGR